MKKTHITILFFQILCISAYSQYRDKEIFDSICHINDIHFVEKPYSNINIYDTKANTQIDTNKTLKSATYLYEVLNKYINMNSAGFGFVDTSIYLKESLIAYKRIFDLKEDELVDSLYLIKATESVNSNYIGFVFQLGGYFSKNVIKKNKTISTVVLIASIGRVFVNTSESISKVHIAIVDKRTRKIIYKDIDNKQFFNNEMPSEKVIINKQVTDLILMLQNHLSFNVKAIERQKRKLEKKRKRMENKKS